MIVSETLSARLVCCLGSATITYRINGVVWLDGLGKRWPVPSVMAPAMLQLRLQAEDSGTAWLGVLLDSEGRRVCFAQTRS